MRAKLYNEQRRVHYRVYFMHWHVSPGIELLPTHPHMADEGWVTVFASMLLIYACSELYLFPCHKEQLMQEQRATTPYSYHGIFTDRSVFSLNIPRVQTPAGTSVTNHKHGVNF